MPEQFKQFDFSKKEDQKKFNFLPQEKKDEVVLGAEDEAAKMQEKIKSGEAKNYAEAVQQVIMNKFIHSLEHHLENAIQIKNQHNLPDEVIQSLVEKKFIELLKDSLRYGEYKHIKHNIWAAALIKNKFNLRREIIRNPETQNVLEYWFLKAFMDSDIKDAIDIKNQFDFTEETVRRITEKAFIDSLNAGSFLSSFRIRDQFNLPRDIIYSSKAQQAAEKGLIIIFSSDFNINSVSINDIKNQLNLPEEIVQRAAVEAFINCLNQGNIDKSLRIKNQLKISEKVVWEATMVRFIYLLGSGDFNSSAEIKDKFNLPEEIAQQAVKKIFIYHLKQGDISVALKIKDLFNLSISSQEIVQENPELSNLIEKTSQFAPEFKTQVEKSSDLAIELCRFIGKPDQLINNLKENPFLVEAIANNPRFSSRLLIKYPEFDEASDENIEKLFTAKNKIMAENPEMDPESLEFRQLMQTELKEFKNNPEIMEAIKKDGINLDEWLNYSETSYFNLSTGGSEIAFSEKIRTPIDRIKETIDSYAYTIKSVLKEYRPEMEKFEIILEDSKLIEDQITKMEVALEQAKIEGNEKKTQGIEKGLVSQKEKLNNLKKGFLWDKLTGEIAAFQRLKNDCFEAQKRLMEAENKLENALSGKMPSGKMIQDIKQAITSSKEELRNKFSNLEGRIEEFKTNLPNLISPCLGQERSEGLIQEIDQKVAEQFNHFESDRTTVANLFSERGDKETNQLESRPMSIFVWARNPDIDLYQGNYSPCCICIDSAHMGAESTIADYNTDLGIQIVNIWDETKNEPVTAAWCWLGQNEKGEKALVIDNIESNTLYSSNFSEQLSNELFEYIEEYAIKIGVNKVVLGKANNDLPVGSELAKLGEDSGQYEKIGGSNRIDGYFLEAEEKSVKLVWQAEEKKVVEKKTKEIPKIEFKNLKTESVSEKNLAKILQAERKIYAGTGLISGQTMVEDIKRGNGFEYSISMQGVRPGKKQAEIVAYIVAVEDETDEGDKSIYMEDIAVLPEAQRQGVGWELLKTLVNKLKTKVQKDGQSILFDMNLREGSQALLQKHKEDLENMGVKLIEEALVPDYYDEGEDSLYQVYQIKAD